MVQRFAAKTTGISGGPTFFSRFVFYLISSHSAPYSLSTSLPINFFTDFPILYPHMFNRFLLPFSLFPSLYLLPYISRYFINEMNKIERLRKEAKEAETESLTEVEAESKTKRDCATVYGLCLSSQPQNYAVDTTSLHDYVGEIP